MSIDDFQKIIERIPDSALVDPEVKCEVYEEFIRYIARGGVNAFHAMKIARLIAKEFDLPKTKT